MIKNGCYVICALASYVPAGLYQFPFRAGSDIVVFGCDTFYIGMLKIGVHRKCRVLRGNGLISELPRSYGVYVVPGEHPNATFVQAVYRTIEEVTRPYIACYRIHDHAAIPAVAMNQRPTVCISKLIGDVIPSSIPYTYMVKQMDGLRRSLYLGYMACWLIRRYPDMLNEIAWRDRGDPYIPLQTMGWSETPMMLDMLVRSMHHISNREIEKTIYDEDAIPGIHLYNTSGHVV